MKYCNNCQAEKESWAEHSSYNSSETFAREERCWDCNRWTLSREVKFEDLIAPNQPLLSILL